VQVDHSRDGGCVQGRGRVIGNNSMAAAVCSVCVEEGVGAERGEKRRFLVFCRGVHCGSSSRLNITLYNLSKF
jgi:hypothetical protein